MSIYSNICVYKEASYVYAWRYNDIYQRFTPKCYED